MKWQATVMAIATIVMGCEDLDPCPGSNVCGVDDNLFTNSRCLCECQDSQRTDPEHMCCDMAEGCTPASDMPDPGSGMTPTGSFPRLHVEGLNALTAEGGATDDIEGCEPFEVVFAYVNISNGNLLAPEGYGLPIPMLEFEEVGIGTAIVPNPRPVAWTTGLMPGAVDLKNEEYDDGIDPNSQGQFTTVVMQVAFLPIATSGITSVSRIIGQFGDLCS